MAYQVELVWNREFDFVPYGAEQTHLRNAISFARAMEESGDGERVKKTRIVNADGVVVWEHGGIVPRACRTS